MKGGYAVRWGNSGDMEDCVQLNPSLRPTDYLDMLRATGSVIRVIEDYRINMVVGYIYYFVERDRYWIAEVRVMPDYRRLGLGRRLIEDLFERIRDRRIEAPVDRDDIASLAFYQSLGFGLVPSFDGDYLAVLMEGKVENHKG